MMSATASRRLTPWLCMLCAALAACGGDGPTDPATDFDLSDSVLDSYAFIDNFQWGCEGEVPPSTTPIE